VIPRRTFLLTPLALLAAERTPNVVLVIARGWRGVSTPWSGDPDLRAPNLAKFAQDAVVFPRAYACDPQSGPAMAGILSGRYPHVTGAIADGASMRAEEVTLDAVLKLAGYNAPDPADAFKNKPASPFFLNVSLAAPNAKPVDAAKFHFRDNVPSNMRDEARGEMARIYGEYTAMDQQFGRLLDSLDSASVAADTIVIFTSDRGNMLGSHGLEGAGVPFEESVRVPLAIRFPRVTHGSASDVLASQVDILPTVLALCGEPAFEGIQGNNLSSVLLGTEGDHPESVFAEGRIGDPDEWRMMVIGSDKLVVNNDGTVTDLYNLAADPYEMKNLARDPGAQLKRDSLLASLRAAKQRLLDFKRR